MRPFSQSAKVSCRSYSTPLQRIITDLGADFPFGRIPKKLKEHYGISVPVSSAQKITQAHAAQVLKEHPTQTQIPASKGVAELRSGNGWEYDSHCRHGIDHRPEPEN